MARIHGGCGRHGQIEYDPLNNAPRAMVGLGRMGLSEPDFLTQNTSPAPVGACLELHLEKVVFEVKF